MKNNLDENLIATLEQNLRFTRKAQNRLLQRLGKVRAEIKKSSDEAEALNSEINALEASANQTESAIYSLLSAMKDKDNNGGS